jgi:epoxyqueuosine reductase QueG
MSERQVDQDLQDYMAQLEADFWGVADLSLAKRAVLDQGGAVVARYPRAVSMGIRLMDAIVDQLPRRAERQAAVSYRHHAYDVVNARLDEMASRLASQLQRWGYTALPVPASKRVDDERISSFFSHKLAANLAGLGWIGKSCLLITPQVGPRVRWTSVLTDAPLRTTGGPIEERCGACSACADICPVGALKGRAFQADELREARFDARKCELYFQELEKGPGPAVCGMCLYVCPYGNN